MSAKRKDREKTRVKNGRLLGIIIAACFAITIIAAAMSYAIERDSTLYTALTVAQIIGFLAGLWTLVLYLSRKFNARRTLETMSEVMQIQNTSKTLWHVFFPKKSDK